MIADITTRQHPAKTERPTIRPRLLDLVESAAAVEVVEAVVVELGEDVLSLFATERPLLPTVVETS